MKHYKILKKNKMRNIILMCLIFFFKSYCAQNLNNESINGIFKKKGSTERIELQNNGSYVLYNSENLGDLALDRCDILSKGQWKKIDNIIDLTSENYYQKQKGFQYELKQETKASKDSIYLNIILPKDFETSIPTPEFNVLFNYKTAKQIETISSIIRISKKEYSLYGSNNQISLDLIFRPSGKTFYTNRLRYTILKDYAIDINKNNYFTINLPYFDQCFYEFEPLYHSIVYVKNKNTLYWGGEEWIKSKI